MMCKLINKLAARLRPVLAIGLLLTVSAALVSAHAIQITGVKVEIGDKDTTVSVVAHVPLLKGADPLVAIPPRIHLRLGGKPFIPEGASVTRDPQNDIVTWTAHENRTASSVQFDAPIFPDDPADTTVILVYRGGKIVDRTMLNGMHPAALLGENRMAVVARFIEEGIFHIINGPDHILFMLGLIIVGGGIRRLLGVVTAFTIAHSITLSLTVLGITSLAPRFVEPLIALSIIAVAIANLVRRRSDQEIRVWMAFAFGFFHGFGFAGALGEVGLPRQALGWSLASFNIGVEIAQGCLVLAIVPMLEYVRRRSQDWSLVLIRVASVIIALAGGFWFVQRITTYRYF